MLLKDYLKINLVKISDLANKSECGQPMLSLISLGKRRPSPDLALKIEAATNGVVTRDELLFPELYLSVPMQKHKEQIHPD